MNNFAHDIAKTPARFQMKADDTQYIIFFDGVCNLCNGAVQFILRHDHKKKFLFGSLQGKAGQEFLAKYSLPKDQFNSFILLEKHQQDISENVYTKSTAALRTLKHLGGGWKILSGFQIVPGFIRDGVYNLIARNRYKWFGKKEACWVPTPELQSRFLD